MAKPDRNLKFNLTEFLSIHKYRDGLEALMWTLLSVPVLMIMMHGGWAQTLDFSVHGSWLKLISRASGLYAANLILIQMIVISRNPFLNYLYGHDKLTAFHKKLGKPAYVLLVIHFVAVIMDYVVQQNKTFMEEFFALFKTEQLAWSVIAFGIITLVVLTSLNMIRKVLPYEVWFYTHILVYVAIVLSFPHQVNFGTDLKGSWLALGYWWGLYIVAVSFIVIFRFGKPIITSLRHQLVVDRVEWETPKVASIYLRGRNLEKLQQNAGQFYMWKFLTLRTFLQTNPFSLSTAPNPNYMRITVSNLGGGSGNIQNVKPGTRVMVDGPYGVFTKNRRLFKHVTLIAAGVGITPVRSLIEEMDTDVGDVTVIYRGNNLDQMPFIDELKQFVVTKGINLHLSVGERGFPSSWLSKEDSYKDNSKDLLRLSPNIVYSDVYVCGPVVWSNAVRKTLLSLGVAKEQIHLEEFAW